MLFRRGIELFVLAGLTVNAQTVNVRGTVSNLAGKPIANATVTLAVQKLSSTTGANGAYTITKSIITQIPGLRSQPASFSLNNGILEIGLPSSLPVKVEFFDVQGNLLKRESKQDVSSGVYRLDILKNSTAAKILVVRATVGNQMITFRFTPLSKGSYAVNRQASPVTARLTKTAAAVVDTIKASATGYLAKALPISSLDTSVNIALDTNGGKNPPGPSLGCGKTLGGINKTGTYTVKSSGNNRTFIINIPSNYDKNTPYRLIFGMHCMGGSAEKVAGTTDQSAYFYHIKTQADKENIPAIYVAMQGDAGGTWQGVPDRTFFFDLQKMLKDTLCIDTTRVFSVGFSFGAMFTYALSLQYPKILRAAACNAPANYNMDQPANQHVPIAYVQVTGTGDGTCPWVSGGSTTNGGKYCLQQHIQDNVCTSTIADAKLATSGTHVVTEFKGCKDGYPVKFCSHNGGHECNKTDQGSNVDWIPVEFWEFFKRF
jgi:poly(3-hydroxybutyrate) depolymerase